MRFFHVFIVLAILSACARQAPPPGGPEDRTPPRILAATPEQGAAHVPLLTRPKIVFNEKVDHVSFEQAFFISPSSGGDKKIRFRWRGKQVEIVFPDSLRSQRTYVITIGTDVRDWRGNRLERAFTLAFSTGDSIDTGEIRGRIFRDKPAGVLIMAYLLSTGGEPHLAQPNPARDFADYLTQVGENGDFSLSHLSDGRYRIFALQDGNGDRRYTHGEEQIGVPSQDIVLSPMHREYRDLNLQLSVADTIQPRLTSLSTSDQAHLELNFDEEVTPMDSLWQRHLSMINSANDSLKIFAAAPHPLNAKQVHVLSSLQQAATYKVFLDQIFDAAGNPLDSLSRQAEFTGSMIPDSSRPRIVKITPADSSRNLAVTANIEMIFSEMLANFPGLVNATRKKIGSGTRPLSLQDSTGKPVRGRGFWLNPFQFRFQPDSLLRGRAQYFVKILSDSTFDPSGNALFDTLKQITFWTMNADTLTEISGMITDAQPDATGVVHLTLKQVGAFTGSPIGPAPSASGAEVLYSLRLPATGPYRFDHILPGLYQLRGFRDANKNGRYDFGSAFPFIPSERFIVWPDTMKVRSRWPNEGNDFVIP